MSGIVVSAIGSAGAILAAIVGYLLAVRKQSGRIATTEAATLWQVLQDHVETLNKRIDALEEDNEELRAEAKQLRTENADLRSRLTKVENGGH